MREGSQLQLAPILPIAPCPRCSRDPGMLWEQGEQAGSEGSKLGARGVSWGLPEALGGLGPREALGGLRPWE